MARAIPRENGAVCRVSILRCQDVHKSYSLGRTELPVLRGIDLSFDAGRFVAIIGNSGSGKSTLLHVLSGLDVPQRGQVWFEGQPLFEPEGFRRIPIGRDSDANGNRARQWQRPGPLKASGGSGGGTSAAVAAPPVSFNMHRDELLNRSFGFVFQFYHLLPEFDVLENVLLPAMVGRSMGNWLTDRVRTEERARSLLDSVGLGDRLAHRPSELSGGERQRVAIARALMNEPAVLFADEPTGNLDTRTGREIFDLLKRLNAAGQTIIMVTHDRELAGRTDQVVQIVDGRVQ